jgi:type IV pilus assembly protein PilN
MRQPANAAVLKRAQFLNALFLKKSFSWTAVMMDLENVLPLGVQVTSIEPQINREGDVLIHLRVSGDRDRAVQLVRNLERSKRFRNPHINSESSETKQGNGLQQPAPNAPWGVEFEILADYVPLPENMPYVQGKKDDDAAEKTVAGARPHAVRHGRRYGVVLNPYVAPKVRGGAR